MRFGRFDFFQAIEFIYCVQQRTLGTPAEIVNKFPVSVSYTHIDVYKRQGYADEVKEWHKSHPDQEAHFFWDKKTAPPVFRVNDRLTFHRINDVKFLEYMQGCSGYVTTAGFESVCEAMYLGKPVMMIPTHVEQEINAADAVGALSLIHI